NGIEDVFEVPPVRIETPDFAWLDGRTVIGKISISVLVNEQSLAVLNHPRFHIAAVAEDDQAILRRRLICWFLADGVVNVTDCVVNRPWLIREGLGTARHGRYGKE